MLHFAQINFATPTLEGRSLYNIFARNMGENDCVVYDDITNRLTFFTYGEEVWHEDNVYCTQPD